MRKSYHIPLSLVLLFIFSVDLKAQEGPEKTTAYDVSRETHLGGSRIYTFKNTDVVDSPLLSDEFKNGRFLFASNNQSDIVPINYDLEQNQILYKKDGQILILENKNIKGFSFELPDDFDSSENIQEVYTLELTDKEFGFAETTPVQVLYNQNGAIKLFALHTVKFVRGNRQDPFTGKITNRYKNDTEYFLETPDNKLHKLRRLKAKEIIKTIGGDSKKELNSFIKQNDLDDKSQKDLVNLLAYYDKKITVSNQ